MEELSKKEIQRRLNSIKVNHKGLNARIFDVSIKYYSFENSIPDKRIDYNLKSELKVISGLGELTISKNNFLFNGHEPDLISEIISNTISKSIYPIVTKYNEKGISSNEILNMIEINERWEKEKKKLIEKCSSNDLNNFLRKFEDKLKSKSLLERTLQYDWFWNLFFHPKLINYGDKRTVETTLSLSVVPYSPPFRFKGIQKIEKIPTNYNSFVINFESEETHAPQYFCPKTKNLESSVFMSLKVSFDLDLYHHFPMHTVAELRVNTKNQFGNNIIKRIEFSMYQVNTDEYALKNMSEDSPFITGGIVRLPPNKWGFDNFENLENDW